MSDSWQGILDEGETLLWQGRPDTRFVVMRKDLLPALFGLAFAGLALRMMAGALEDGPFPALFLLLFVAAGLAVAVATPFRFWLRRRVATYSLSTRRAFIANLWPRKMLRAYEIAPDDVLELAEGSPGSVYFRTQYRNTAKGSRRERIGFERIDEARHVYDLLRQVQRSRA
ncbi:aspartate carbamoyltransferase catalytic subunit [Pseudoruegeria sp. SHC-113]|uniref:aspartate carbamoyltransferase catalytic subunit n=1 Tax=Pseudoruegeria sp. SHC-113 TaxID=2855439 RepID=UPI0021BB7939|nr:aspartate carbamoyltransferase catalytic subunit [Pseudoruegeria sp. SHC-113]MCT8158911.1 aspartate carbamoyltransferase catalytic subunit [Pseudoruegeria sp. SHC-113]